MRIEGIDARFEPEVTTTGTQSDISIWKLQGGADFMLHEGASGYLIGGVTLHYGTANSDITSRFGDGSIDTKGYGAGVSATWYANSGLYIDGQLNVTKFDSDLSSATLGGLTNGNDGTGYAASVELGQGFPVGQNTTLIPQAQLTYSSVNFDDFTGPYGERVSLDDGESLQLRLGIAAEHEVTTADSQQLLYGIFNLYREFDGGIQIDVSGVKQSSEGDDWSAKVGLGGQYTWSEAYPAYGEVSYATGVENLGDSRRVQASLGVRIDF
ncbi:autotransporter family protein [Yoonia sp. MH D7]